jgi:5S rRNA maturation endonuclease (ribonuclease M5)
MKQKSKRRDKLTSLRGIILPTDWDKDGNVIALGLSGTDEKDYRIEVKAKKPELLGLLQKEVEVTGLLKEEAGTRTILLKRYRQI